MPTACPPNKLVSNLAKNNLANRDNELTVKDVVDGILNKQPWGMEGYNPKPVVKDMLPARHHVKAKARRIMFCEEASMLKDKVPAPSRYQEAIDWKKNPTSRNIRFATDWRHMIADVIVHNAKKPEKTSPGPTAYDDHDAWKYKQKKNIPNYDQRDERITFMQT